MAQTKFSGPVVSTNGFNTEGAALTLATPTSASNAAAFTAAAYITIVGQNGTTYYVPVATSAW